MAVSMNQKSDVELPRIMQVLHNLFGFNRLKKRWNQRELNMASDIVNDSESMGPNTEDVAQNFTAKDGQWLRVMKSIQDLDETLNHLDSNVKSQACNIPSLMKELLNKDNKSTEQSWDSLRINWTSKCREIIKLKKSFNRLVDEKTRLRDENQGLERSISRLQEQFSQSVSSSLVEIQSLTTANSRLSEEIQRSEEIIMNDNVKVRKTVRDRLEGFGQQLNDIITDRDIRGKLQDLLQTEIVKIENCLMERKNIGNTGNSYVDAAINLGKSIENKRLETMEVHLRELEMELTDKNKRIKELETSNDVTLQENGSLVSDVAAEERNWFDYMKKSIMSSEKLTQADCVDVFEISLLSKGLVTAQHFVQDVKENLADVYRGTINNEDELHDIRGNMDEVSIKWKSTQAKLETMEGENEYLKRKLDQEEGKLKVSRDDVISLQSRLNMLKNEKEAAELQINDMKSGKEDFKEFCSNLSAENEKLFTEIARLQSERDSALEQIQEWSKKHVNRTKESKVFEEKCEYMEGSLAKLKREYQEQSRELQTYVKENDEMRLMLHEKEASFTESQNEFRNIDIVNKDLEDQVFQITNENEKLQMEISKLKAGKKQLEIDMKEKRLLIERLEKSERGLEERVREVSKLERSGHKNSSELKNDLEINEEILEKSLDKVAGLAEIVRQILKQTKSVLMELGGDENPDLLDCFDSLIRIDISTDENGNTIDQNNQIVELITKTHNVLQRKFKDAAKFLQDVYSIINKVAIRFTFDDSDCDSVNTIQEKMRKSKSRLTWIIKDYKRLYDGPTRVDDSEKMQALKDILLRYIVAATKQLEVILNNVSGKDCVMMLLPTSKDMETSTQDSNEDLIKYLRDTFRANQMALQTAVGTLELVKLKGECDVISDAELTSKITDSDQNELCVIMKRMNQYVDLLTEKIQGLITSAEMVRTSSSSSFDSNQDVFLSSETETNNRVSRLQFKAVTSLAEKRGDEISKLKSEIDFMKKERAQLLSELQEKDFDLGKLEHEISRLVTSSTGLEDQFSKMKLEYQATSKDLAKREEELKTLKDDMKQRDREGDAGELSSTESARSEIVRKEGELRRLRSSLEDIRSVHCLNEGRIKNLQNKIEGVTQIMSSRETIKEEPVQESTEEKGVTTSHHREQLLVVREIELKTSKAEFCDAEELRKKNTASMMKQASKGAANNNSDINKKLKNKEQENNYLQSVVKELKMELMDVQRGLSQEQVSRSQLNNMMMMNGRQNHQQQQQQQRSQPRSKFEAAYENEKLRRRNREYDQIRRNYLDDSFNIVRRRMPESNSHGSPNHIGYQNHFGHESFAHDSYAHDPSFEDGDCEICAMESVSGASTYICSDEECESCEYASCEMSDTSFASDDDYDRSRMVSPGYRGVFSREAKNVTLQEATFAIKSQHRRNRRNTNSPPPMHNPPASPSPKRKPKHHEFDYDRSAGKKYSSSQITRSNSARYPSGPRSTSSDYDNLERRYSLDRRISLDRRPLSESGRFHKRESLQPGSPVRSHQSSDECSSMSSGSGQCCGAEGQHECKKRKSSKNRGKLV
eukprot:gene13895-15343_t